MELKPAKEYDFYDIFCQKSFLYDAFVISNLKTFPKLRIFNILLELIYLDSL